MRQKAAALALFGLVVGCLCTRATLLAVREEGEVVSLAVELAAKEQKARHYPTTSVLLRACSPPHEPPGPTHPRTAAASGSSLRPVMETTRSCCCVGGGGSEDGVEGHPGRFPPHT